jgi:prepilin-type N-terminal cleavage/methylation domain-containing protein
MRRLTHIWSEEGFTLTELMISITLMGVVLSAAYLLLNTVSLDSNLVQARSQAAEENRHAMEVISTEIRQAVEAVSSYGAFDSSTLSATYCTIYSDIDRDGVPEKVSYYVQNGKLMKTAYQHGIAFSPYNFSATQMAGYPKVVVSGVTNADVFTYFDGQSPPQVVPASRSQDISAVTIHIVDTATVSGSVGTSDITTWVKIRSVHNSVQ